MHKRRYQDGGRPPQVSTVRPVRPSNSRPPFRLLICETTVVFLRVLRPFKCEVGQASPHAGRLCVNHVPQVAIRIHPLGREDLFLRHGAVLVGLLRTSDVLGGYALAPPSTGCSLPLDVRPMSPP